MNFNCDRALGVTSKGSFSNEIFFLYDTRYLYLYANFSQFGYLVLFFLSLFQLYNV